MRHKRKQKIRPETAPVRENKPLKPLTLGLDDNYRNIFHILILSLFAIYLTILYFGHQVVPNSDFIAFFRTGEQILSGQFPTSFKRLPGLGVLQVLISYCVPSSCNVAPSLMAGWILNSVCYVGIGICLYKIAKQVVGSSAIWYCLLMLINPMMLVWMRNPIVETSFTFSIILAFVFIMKGTRWAYVFVVIACMFRYEAAFLLPPCFFMDFFSSQSRRQKVFSFVRAGLATLPLAVWMILTITRRSAGTAIGRLDYIRNYDVSNKMVIGKFTNYMWENCFQSLSFYPIPSTANVIYTISKILVVIAILAAVGYAVYKKQWKPLGLMIFLVLFYIMHAIRNYTMPRYGFPGIWVTVLVVWYGFQSLWSFLNEQKWFPAAAKYILPIVVIFVTLPWAIYLRTQQSSEPQYVYKVQAEYISQRSASVPAVMLTVIGLTLIGGFFLFKRNGGFTFKKTIQSTALISVLFFAVTSNQFLLSQKVSNGAIDLEFKMLADWYRDNAMGKKLVCTMSHVMDLYLPKSNEVQIYRYSAVKGGTPEEFIQDCIQKHIEYIAWDSRIGYSPTNKYYKQWKMERVAFLVQPQTWGPLEFVTKIQNEYYQNRFINLYRITYPETSFRNE